MNFRTKRQRQKRYFSIDVLEPRTLLSFAPLVAITPTPVTGIDNSVATAYNGGTASGTLVKRFSVDVGGTSQYDYAAASEYVYHSSIAQSVQIQLSSSYSVSGAISNVTVIQIPGGPFFGATLHVFQDSDDNGTCDIKQYDAESLNSSIGLFEVTDAQITDGSASIPSGTDANATVEFDMAAKTTYFFVVEPTGGQFGTNDPQNDDVSGSSELDIPFHFTMAPISSISGTVFNDANNNATLDSGESGIPGVTVYADLANSGSIQDGDPAATTDSSGNYTIPGLIAGSYTFRQITPSGYSQTFPTGGQAENVTLGATAATGLNFGDHQNTFSISGTVFSDVNNNTTLDSGETGVSGVTVYADLANTGAFQNGDPSATSDSAGQYTIAGLLPGTFKIRQITPSGYSQTFPIGAAANPVILGAANSTGVNFGDHLPTFAISGTVFFDANENATLDSGESGIIGVTVYADLANSGSFQNGDPTTTTDSSGNYTIQGLAAGTYNIRQVVPSDIQQTLPAGGGAQNVTVGASDVLNADFGDSQQHHAAPAALALSVNGASLATGQSLDLGDASVGQPLQPLTLTLTNTGGSDLNVTGITPPTGFQLVNAPTFPLDIPAGATSTIGLAISPSSATSNVNGQLTINSNDAASPFTLALSGNTVNGPVPTLIRLLPKPGNLLGGMGNKSTRTVMVSVTNDGTQALAGPVTLTVEQRPIGSASATVLRTLPIKMLRLKSGAIKAFPVKVIFPDPGADTNYNLLALAFNTAGDNVNPPSILGADVILVEHPVGNVGAGSLQASGLSFAKPATVAIPISLLETGNVPAVGMVNVAYVITTKDGLTTLGNGSLPARPLSLKPGISKTVRQRVPLPTTLAAGSYKIIFTISFTHAATSLASDSTFTVTVPFTFE